MSAKILHLDIETLPSQAYVWGLFNQNIGINQIVTPGRTTCFAAKWHGKKKIMFASEWEDGFESMVERAHELLTEADIIVHYNGTKFDIPTLQREFVLQDLSPPEPFRQIDLLRTVKRQFRFQSNKLDYVSQQLGIGAKTQHKGQDLWTGVMNGVRADQKVMKEYNKQDVVLTEELYTRLLPWLVGNPVMGAYNSDTGEEGASCPKCGSTAVHFRGYYTTQAGRYHKFQCQSCNGWGRVAANTLPKGQRVALGRNIV